MKKRVFVSFDFDNDKTLKDFVVGQARLADSPFEVADWSMKEAAPKKSWEEEANRRICSAELVIVMVGTNTHRAPGVLKEVKMARAAGKRIVQFIGYKDANPTPVPDAGRLYRWTWQNLQNLLA
jgi:hypothetical protein